jgi:hypothetical protein
MFDARRPRGAAARARQLGGLRSCARSSCSRAARRVRVRLRRIRVHDEVQLAGQVVDDRELLGEQQADRRAAERIGLRVAPQARLDVAHAS